MTTVGFKCWKQLKNKRHTQWNSLNFQLQVLIKWTVVLCCRCNFLSPSVLELAIKQTHFWLLWAGTLKGAKQSCFTYLTCHTFILNRICIKKQWGTEPNFINQELSGSWKGILDATISIGLLYEPETVISILQNVFTRGKSYSIGQEGE